MTTINFTPDKLVERVRSFIDTHNLWNTTSPIVVGVSGGIDSMVLLDVISRISQNPGNNLIIAHFNHGYRHNSDCDEEFVKTICKTKNLTFISEKLQTLCPKGVSKEAFWHSKRYEFLEKIRQKYNAERIALAHHLDDQIETIFLNLIKGCGMQGLLGIPLKMGCIIRPLLFLLKSEIIDYAVFHHIDYRQDLSNQDTDYPRNYLRHQVIQSVKSLNPDLGKALLRMQNILRSENDWAKSECSKVINQAKWSGWLPWSIEADFFDQCHEAKLNRFSIRLLSDILKNSEDPITSRLVRNLSSFLIGENKKLTLPGNVKGCWLKKQIFLLRLPSKRLSVQPRYLKIPGKMKIGYYTISTQKLSTKPKNHSRAVLNSYSPLFVRKRQPGDYFIYNDSGKKKSLNSYLYQHSVPGILRDYLPVIVNTLGEVIAVIGIAGNERIILKDKKIPILLTWYANKVLL